MGRRLNAQRAKLYHHYKRRGDVVEHKPNCAGFKSNAHRTAEICESWCWGHMTCEPLPKDNSHYQVCGECMHVFVTAEDLLNAHNEKGRESHERLKDDPMFGSSEEFKPTENVDEVFFCPVCIHDF